MAVKNEGKLTSKLQDKAKGTNVAPPTPAQTIGAYLQKMAPEIEKALPKHMDVDRLTRISLTTIRTNPALMNCSMPSLLGAVMQAAQLGLEPGLLGHCYIIPYGKEATFIIGYKGMIDLARRSGNIKSIYAHPVYENDEFSYKYGLNPDLQHTPAMKERGEFIGAYAVAHFNDGGYQFEFMPKEEIEKRKLRSKSYSKGPWQTDYEEMAMKTVVRHMFKFLPISIEVMQSMAQDETVRKDITSEPKSVYSDEIEAEGVFAEDIRMDEPAPAGKQPEGEEDELAKVAKEFDEGKL
ncbi:recombination protein RecT [Aneurinibacillus migulanus]|uniref:Recombinase RecT n=1 Tax=Aneurinibacillus migulanus TaxID=47500 RepID=A0A0D1Y108_ANEMI|nr:recombination protein RecT [Aneurinibacillus migulanus]KIV52922.1 recombinase RecT [Aneurinibacillus migulanus]KON95200.1 recombinase RecT [Aneurinibacillus migulanus]MED0890944.1 recombination protein RecT [Aneurinibacillus migulanus]MED1616636.1 recombination protein RecT [Aneurinibacillus migulanus]SDI83188.1 recombination protein RecT [Aneurinibacillus migulanus]